jgi:fumarate hydratase subunit beta
MIRSEGGLVRITTPLTDEDVEKLKAGDQVRISGRVYSARDAAHKRMIELIDAGRPLPFDVCGQIIYYVGPTPARPGMPIGSAGPTTASRMDSTTEPLLKLGLKGTLGKGNRGEECARLFPKYRAVHFAAIGGSGAYLSKRIRSERVICWEELGTEAPREMEFDDFPAFCINDVHGADYYKVARERWAS